MLTRRKNPVLTPQTAIYHPTTWEIYKTQEDGERYRLKTPDQKEASLVAQTNLEDAVDRARKLAARQQTTPLLLLIDSTIVSTRLTFRGVNRDRGIVYTLSHLEKGEYDSRFLSMNGMSAAAQARSILNSLQQPKKE